MTTGNVGIKEGADKIAATYSISEDAVTKQIQRVALNSESGAEIDVGTGTAASALRTVTASDDPLLGTNTQLPAVLGSQAAAVSLSSADSTEDVARTGIITETAPATDTASSGLNGRLQRIAQRISSLLALFTATAATDANRLPTAEPDGLQLTPAGVTSATTIFTQDMTGYESVSVQVISAGTSCTITYETSDNNVDWLSVAGTRQDAIAGSGALQAAVTSTTLGMTKFGKWGRYFRARVSTYGSGTVTVVASFNKAPYTTSTAAYIGNALQVSGPTAHDVAVAQAPILLGGSSSDYGSDPTAVSADEDVTRLVVTRQGNLKTVQEYSYNHISTATTTTVKSGAGILHNISVNTKGTVASTITVYDNTAGSGAVIGVINSLDLSGSFIMDVVFLTGLTVVTTGTIAPDITVSYK